MGFDGGNTYLETFGGTLLVNYYEQNKVIFTGEVGNNFKTYCKSEA